MAKVLSKLDIPPLLDFLTKFSPYSNKIYHICKNSLKGILSTAEVVVDTWPDPHMILVKQIDVDEATKNVETEIDGTIDLFSTAITNIPLSFLEEYIPWNKRLFFCALQEEVKDIVEECISRKLVESKMDFGNDKFILHCFDREFEKPGHHLPDGFEICKMDATYSDYINSRWTYGGTEETRLYIEFLLNNFPSLCIRNCTTKNLSSYCLTNGDGSIGMWHTDPEERGKGFGKRVLMSLAEHLSSVNNQQPFLFTSVKNKNAQQILNSLGWTKVLNYHVYWGQYTPYFLKDS